MKIVRWMSFLFGALAWFLPALLYISRIRFFGFPDGHLTELERAERLLFQALLWPSAVFGVAFIAVGWRQGRTGKTGGFWIIVGCFGLFSLMIGAIDLTLRFCLDHGAGG